ncbi:MAG: hypothetical protein U9R75_02085 [Candidatus Thermoplasmatota archaeon]|nr:hypothetical protein [Candidatus Thermoplasmatota archaeon]
MRSKLLITLLVVLLFIQVPVFSLRLGYHDENVEQRSVEVFQNSTHGAPMSGVFEGGRFTGPFESSFLVPFPQYDLGNGTISLFSNDGELLTNISIYDSKMDLSEGSILTGDLNGDKLDDIIVRDVDMSHYLFRGQSEDDLDANTVLGPGERLDLHVLINASSVIRDLDGDGICEIITLADNGSHLRSIADIVGEPYIYDEIELPVNASKLYSADDLNGDLSPDILVYCEKISSASLLVYSGVTMERSSILALPGTASSVSVGDMNGDKLDDITLHVPAYGPKGGVMVVPGGFGPGLIDVEDISWNIRGEGSMDLTGEQNVLLLDIDGDRSSDLIIGDPEKGSGKGKLSVFYGGPDRDYSTDSSYLFPDADMVGNDTAAHLGLGIYYSPYDMSSPVPVIYLGKGDALVKWNIPTCPDLVVQGYRFLEAGQGQRIERAQRGERVGIWLFVSQGSPTRIDYLRVWLQGHGEEFSPPFTSIILTETGPGTGVLYGEFVLGNFSMDSRSQGTSEGAYVKVFANWEELPVSLYVKGRIWTDDPPYFADVYPPVWRAFEDSSFDREISVFDPDGDVVEWDFSTLPSWIEQNDGSLTGVPGNDDVGELSLNVSISSTIHSVNLTVDLIVVNKPPSIVEVSVAPMAWEGQPYTSRFDLRENGNGWNVSVNVTRNGSTLGDEHQWLEVERNGTVKGVPSNMHVGNWTASLVLDDNNVDPSGMIPNKAIYQWNISVVNEVPKMITPEVDRIKEYEPTVLDFGSDQEGEEGTVYSIVSTNIDDLWLNPVTGEVSFTPIIGIQEAFVTIKVTDLWGESSEVRLDFFIENAVPYLTSPLPDVMVAGELFEMDMDSNEEGNDLLYLIDPHPPVFSNYNSYVLGGEGRSGFFPWNMDAGDHEHTVVLRDNLGAYRNYTWNFTVLPNASFTDPDLDFTILEITDSKLVLDVGLNCTNLNCKDTMIHISESKYGPYVLSKVFNPSDDGAVEFDISGFNGTIWITAEVGVEFLPGDSRSLEMTYTVVIPEIDGSDSGKISLLMLFMLVFLLILLVAGSSLALVERTSYAFQTVIFKGGEPQEEVVLSSVQDDPGRRLRELGDSISISRRDLVTTLVALEDEGHVRSVPDGIYVRFLPTVGSFIDGPLVMSRYQIRIAKVLLDRKKLSETALIEESGLSKKKLDREASLLKLKGAISERSGPQGSEYYMSSRQKKRVRNWIKREK